MENRETIKNSISDIVNTNRGATSKVKLIMKEVDSYVNVEVTVAFVLGTLLGGFIGIAIMFII